MRSRLKDDTDMIDFLIFLDIPLGHWPSHSPQKRRRAGRSGWKGRGGHRGPWEGVDVRVHVRVRLSMSASCWFVKGRLTTPDKCSNQPDTDKNNSLNPTISTMSSTILLPGQPLPSRFNSNPLPNPGKGCYLRDGKLLASVVGVPVLDGQVRKFDIHVLLRSNNHH